MDTSYTSVDMARAAPHEPDFLIASSNPDES